MSAGHFLKASAEHDIPPITVEEDNKQGILGRGEKLSSANKMRMLTELDNLRGPFLTPLLRKQHLTHTHIHTHKHTYTHTLTPQTPTQNSHTHLVKHYKHTSHTPHRPTHTHTYQAHIHRSKCHDTLEDNTQTHTTTQTLINTDTERGVWVDSRFRPTSW